LVAASDDVAFDRIAASDGDELTAGSLTIRVVATPRHTVGLPSYIVTKWDGSPAVFGGESLLFASEGPTDVVDPDWIDELTRARYQSARRLATLAPDDCVSGYGASIAAGLLDRPRQEVVLIDDDYADAQRLIDSGTRV
jgi:hydroxyacylglutathione hydrolase